MENKYVGLITAIITGLLIHLLNSLSSYKELADNNVFLLFSLIVFGLLGFVIGNILMPKNALKTSLEQNKNKKNEEINIYGDEK